jgi:orotidine-5'-phosphate decarboxylase
MQRPAAAAVPSNRVLSNIRERIIVALDVPSAVSAREIVDQLGDAAGAFKVGMQLFTSAGPVFVWELIGRGIKVFLDLKFHDIPNTVAAAGVEAAKMGVWMFNVHAAGGHEMMHRTVDSVVEFCESTSNRKPVILGVTVLTSSKEQTLIQTGVTAAVEDQVSRLARLSFDAGLDGVVASPREVGIVRKAVEDQAFLTVTPGIRNSGATSDDQRRVTTIGEAFAGGSDFVVIGRPIIGAVDRRVALEKLVEEARQQG